MLGPNSGIFPPQRGGQGAAGGAEANGAGSPVRARGGRVRGQDPLFEGFRRADPEAVREVCSIVQRTVRFHGFSIPASERDEIAGQAVLEIWRAVVAPAFSVQESFAAFVREVAYRRSIDWIRRHRDDDRGVSLDACGPEGAAEARLPGLRSNGPGPEEELLEKERREIGARALRRMAEHEMKLVWLCTRQSLNLQQAAARLGISHDAARQRWCTLMKRLARDARRLLGDSREERNLQ